MLDTDNLTYAEGELLATTQKYANHISYVHCKDIRPKILKTSLNRDASFLDAVVDGVFTVLGDGCVDYPSIMQDLEKADYNGWLMAEAEQDPAVANPLTYATKGYHYLSQLILR